MLKPLFTALLFLCATHALAQKTQIRDVVTDEPIPFATVSCANGKILADIDGYFSLNCAGNATTFHASGYRDTVMTIQQGQVIVYLEGEGAMLNEVTIPSVDEEANRIMARAADNRKSNHPNGKSSYTYTSYSKFMFTLNPDALARMSDTIQDTSLLRMKRFFDSQHLFLMESTTNRFFEPPYREKEEITAYKVSGFKDPMLSSFASELQTFHFYENQFTLLGETFTSPIAFGNTRRYIFQLLETIVSPNGDSTFHIRYRPYFDKNFKGMKGEIFINSRNYAIEKVIASPAEKSETLNATIVQEYQYSNGRWFPHKLSTEATFPGIKISDEIADGYMIAKGTTYIENLKFDVDLKKEKFNAATVITKDDAAEKDSAHWNKERVFELNDKETRTYEMIDSMSAVHHFDAKLKYASSLLEGKVPIGYVQLDLTRLLNYHQYEGYRFGLGLENSSKLMKRVTIGGYGAYGNRDKAWKYGAYLKALLVPKQFIGLEMKYQDDIAVRGGTGLYTRKDVLSLNNIYEEFYVSQMDRQRLAEISFNGYFLPTLGWRIGTSYQRLWFTQDYRFTDNGVVYEGLDQHEISGQLTWNIGEKVKYLGNRRISSGTNKPQIRLATVIGLKGLEESALNYQRVFLDVNERVKLRAAGLLQMRLSVAKTFGNVPLFWMNAANGTGGNWNLTVPNTFETMPASTFYNSEQIAFYFRYTTKSLKTKLKWTAPRLGAHYAMGTGSLRSAGSHSISVPSMSKGYYETGLIAENVLVLNTTGLGIGAFVPFGSLVSPDLSKTVTFKIALTVVLN